jgi:hypothetical protein
MNFKCECGSTRIEEVMTDVTQYSVVDTISVIDDGELCMEYGTTNTEGGDVDHYQCVSCGRTVDKHELLELAEHVE